MPWKKPELIMYSSVRFVPKIDELVVGFRGWYVNRRFKMPESPLSS